MKQQQIKWVPWSLAALLAVGSTSFVGAETNGVNASYWQKYCSDESKPPEGNRVPVCINFGLANGFQRVISWMSHLDQTRREESRQLPRLIRDLYDDNQQKASAVYRIGSGLDRYFEDRKFRMKSLGTNQGEVTIDSLGVGIAQAPDRGMQVRIYEQLAQAAGLYTGVNANEKSTTDAYLTRRLPRYCARELTQYSADPGNPSAKGIGLRNCLPDGKTRGAPQPFANFDIMASSLLGPSQYDDKGLANTFAWLNHSNWVHPKVPWSNANWPNRFTEWSRNNGDFRESARDYITVLMGASYRGLPAQKVFSENGGAWIFTEEGKSYFMGMRQVAALRSLALNSFYHMYYDRYPQASGAIGSGAVSDTGTASVLSVLEAEVNKRFGQTDTKFCLPANPNDPGTPAVSQRCQALVQAGKLPQPGPGLQYVDAAWHDFVSSLPPELVQKEMAQMMAVDLALKYKTYRQNERIEALLAAQLSVLTKQLENMVSATTGGGTPTAGDMSAQFESISQSVAAESAAKAQ